MKNRSGEKIKLASIDELLGVVNEESAMEIEISKIHPFKNHPFKVLDDEKMQELVESVKINGVLAFMWEYMKVPENSREKVKNLLKDANENGVKLSHQAPTLYDVVPKEEIAEFEELMRKTIADIVSEASSVACCNHRRNRSAFNRWNMGKSYAVYLESNRRIRSHKRTKMLQERCNDSI